MVQASRIYAFFLSLSLLSFIEVASAESPLKYEHIPIAVNEMLAYHVEFDKLNPTLVRRSFNLFVAKFDPKQTYLLRSEVDPFYSLTDQEAKGIIADLYKGKFPEYVKLNKMIISSIQRARKIRATIRTQLLSQKDLDLSKSISQQFSFPETQNDLYLLNNTIMHNWLVYYAKEKKIIKLDPAERLKVLNYFEKKRRAHEDQYLVTFEKPEPAFALNILKSLAASLDAHTMYYSPEEAAEIRVALLKQFCGVGLHLQEGVDGLYVAGVIENSPAARTKLITQGDILKQIDATPVEDMYFSDVLKLLDGPQYSKVSFLFEKPSSNDKVTVTLQREKISLESERIQVTAEPFADGVIGKISMTSFYENEDGISLEKDIRDALKELRSNGPIYGLILDLRYNAGGFLNQAIKTAGLFIKNGVVVIAKYANDQIQYQRDLDPRSYYDGPLVVLSSKASASAAEILAASLQDEGVAVIVGDERSYGKGTMQYQTITDPNARDFYKVTVGRYFTISGKSTQIEGVKSDIVVPTFYAPYEVGEKYLKYPLASENLLQKKDIKEEINRLFVNYKQRKGQYLELMLSRLKENSKERLLKNRDFSSFLEEVNQKRFGVVTTAGYGKDDLQMQEAVQIVKDMIILRNNRL